MNCDRSDPRPVATLPTGVSCYYRCNRGIMSLPLSQFRYRYEFLSLSHHIPLSPRRRRERVARFTVLSLRSFPLRGRLRREDGERDVETRGS